MAKLYFRYGAMSSAKTLNLLAVAHSYESQGKQVVVMKPKMETRFGAGVVQSRAGLDRKADFLLTESSTFEAESLAGCSCVLVDESQFLHPRVIERLRDVATFLSVPVICYGLRTDFRSRLFPGSQRLMELADSIEEVKTTCTLCNRKGTMNLKCVDGAATLEGPTVCLGAEEMYSAVCYTHFCESVVKATGKAIDFAGSWEAGAAADAAAAAAAAAAQPATPRRKPRSGLEEPSEGAPGKLELEVPEALAAIGGEPEMELSPQKS